MKGMKNMRQKSLDKQNYVEKRLCEGHCQRLLDMNDLDMENGKFICKECELNFSDYIE